MTSSNSYTEPIMTSIRLRFDAGIVEGVHIIAYCSYVKSNITQFNLHDINKSASDHTAIQLLYIALC